MLILVYIIAVACVLPVDFGQHAQLFFAYNLDNYLDIQTNRQMIAQIFLWQLHQENTGHV